MKASLSLDLDNKWSYMKTHGDAAWQSFPRICRSRSARSRYSRPARFTITFFIVGQDAALSENADVLSEIARRGHEIANHSHHHEPWMHRRGKAAIDEELAQGGGSDRTRTGRAPARFPRTGIHSVRVDPAKCSCARLSVRCIVAADVHRTARPRVLLSQHEAQPGGSRASARTCSEVRDGFRPNRQHAIALANGSLAEIPVTTFPGFGRPIHVSYVLYLAIDFARPRGRIFQGGSRGVPADADRAFDSAAPARLSDRARLSRAAVFPGNESRIPDLKERTVLASDRRIGRGFERGTDDERCRTPSPQSSLRV